MTACAAAPTPAARQVDSDDAAQRTSVFKPNPQDQGASLDYGPLNEILGQLVLETGMSLRQRVAPPPQMTGTRIARGTASPLRLEGNKVAFSRVDDEAKAMLEKYATALIDVSNKVDISALPRNEQLAYWFNLHNVLVISQIATHYPVRKPTELEVEPNDQRLHDAPIATVAGVPLSLRDIRINIVQRYWKDPRVMYGFFHGDLASPKIRREAWSASNLASGLDGNAREFVNALRGVDRRRSQMVVSPLYKEAQGSLFPNWPDDFRRHLGRFAEAEVAEILAETKSIEFARREDRTADLVGGAPQASISRIDGFTAVLPGDARIFRISGMGLPNAAPANNARPALVEVRRKLKTLSRQRPPDTQVDIEDAPFDAQTKNVEVIR